MRLIDAAIKDLEMIGDCRTCGNKTPFCDSNPDGCSGYKWRGVPPDSAGAGECIKKRQAKRAIIEYDDNSRQILRKGIICWFDGDGKTYVADYELIGLAERDVVVLAHSITELGEKLLALKGDV